MTHFPMVGRMKVKTPCFQVMQVLSRYKLYCIIRLPNHGKGREKIRTSFPSINQPPTIMSPEDIRHFNNLLKNFEAERLGEGDAVVGANVLAAMAVSLANIQRPGSGLTTWLGDTMAVGSSILVSGSYSTSLISEKILSGLAMRQNNLTARFGQGSRVSDPELGRFKSTHPASGDFAGNLAETIMDQLGMPGAITDQQAIECWGSILKIPVQTNLSYLRGHPMVFITGTKTAELTGQLERCHLRRPLIHIGIDGIGDFARLDILSDLRGDASRYGGQGAGVPGWGPLGDSSNRAPCG